MVHIQHVVDTKIVSGKSVNIVRNFFIHEKEGNTMANAHKYFTKEDRKLAKLNHVSNS